MALSRSTAKPLTPSLWPPGDELGSSRTLGEMCQLSHLGVETETGHTTSRQVVLRDHLRLWMWMRGFDDDGTETRQTAHTVAYPLTCLLGHGDGRGKAIIRDATATGRRDTMGTDLYGRLAVLRLEALPTRAWRMRGWNAGRGL